MGPGIAPGVGGISSFAAQHRNGVPIPGSGHVVGGARVPGSAHHAMVPSMGSNGNPVYYGAPGTVASQGGGGAPFAPGQAQQIILDKEVPHNAEVQMMPGPTGQLVPTFVDMTTG